MGLVWSLHVPGPRFPEPPDFVLSPQPTAPHVPPKSGSPRVSVVGLNLSLASSTHPLRPWCRQLPRWASSEWMTTHPVKRTASNKLWVMLQESRSQPEPARQCRKEWSLPTGLSSPARQVPCFPAGGGRTPPPPTQALFVGVVAVGAAHLSSPQDLQGPQDGAELCRFLGRIRN